MGKLVNIKIIFLFYIIFLTGCEKENNVDFKLVYSDEQQLPLALFQGTVIGPLRIWEISYPEHIEENPSYLDTEYPLELR